MSNRETLRKLLNPFPKFDPTTFEPHTDLPADLRRVRREPGPRLPTMNLMPKTIMEGQMIGMYESKQDLYLLIAWLSNRVSDLEEKVNVKTPEKGK